MLLYVLTRIIEPTDSIDVFWFCENCNNKLDETTVRFDDPTDAAKTATDSMKSDAKLRTGSKCGEVLAI